MTQRTCRLFCVFVLGGWGHFASCHFSVTKISDAFLERLSIVHPEFWKWPHPDFIDVWDISVMTTSLQFETKSLPLNVSFPDRDILPTTAFRAKRKCSKLQFVEALSRFGGSANSCSHAARCLYFGGWQACSSRKCSYLSKTKTNSETVTLSRWWQRR